MEDLNRVAIFVRVAEAGSFTAASATLGLPKSSVSRSVLQLENELGVRLLQRTTRKLALTDAGRAYFERARAALADLEGATAAVAADGTEPRGTVRITAPVDAGTTLLADLVTRFVRQYPRVQVELSLTARRVDLVAEGFDLALRAGRLDDSTLVARRIGTTDVGLYAAPEYLDRRGRPGTIADLAEHDCVLFRAQGGRATWSLEGPQGEETVEVTGAIMADDLSFVLRAVLAGGGVGLMPIFLCAEPATRGELVRLLPSYAFHGAALHVVLPSAQHVPARVALFRDFLIAHLNTIAWNGAPTPRPPPSRR
ncbi:MAG TPA: LysR family transcriptional regulator [Polyangia bacterium]|nr:LysR family transcriptional regulator [Polyangia bacterium]